MRRASLNHVFRLKWSDRTRGLVPVAERTVGRGKRSTRVFGALASLTLVTQAYAGGGAPAAALPTGGVITAGSGTISQTGNVLTVNQTSSKLITQWSSFNIAPGDVVKYVQPSSSAVSLNRVSGSDPSLIQGALIANGQVFLLNPNGILFSQTAKVNAGGLVASTLNIADSDFLAGNYRFSASKPGSVTNLGNITAGDGGVVALIAAKVENAGNISANRGAVLLGAGDQIVLDVGAPVKLQITQGALDALVSNGGALRADGGTVLLTAKAANDLMTTVIRNTGTVEAQTLSTGEKGQILLLGGMTDDEITIGGVLDASAPHGGDGGHIETSAAHVDTSDGLSVTAGAAAGRGGDWLVDPYDYTINSTAATNIATALNQGTSVTVTTQSSNTSYGGSASSGSGDITVSSAITKTSGGAAALTLQADRSIYVNSPISSSSGALGITLSAGNAAGATVGGVSVAANLNSNGGRILIGGAAGSTSHGIGYALNATASSPAVSIGTGVSVQSGGGDITVNGTSTATTTSYSGTGAGIYVLSGGTLNSGGGNLYMSGISQSAAKEFGFAVEANSNTLTSFTTSGSSGAIVLDAQNLANVNGALGLVSNGNQARVQFTAPSVAQIQVSLNGSLQSTTFGYSPPCNTGFPNCGTMTIPGSNGSYLSADYQVVSMATYALYVETGNGSKTYNGSTSATGLTLSTLNAPADFSTAGLTFTTSSKNAGTYTSLVSGAGDPTSFTSTNGHAYAVGYDYGNYTINPLALTVTASNKPYDGTTAAALSASGIVAGDSVSFSATGGFASANVGNNIAVNASGITLSGADAGNYSIGSGSLSTTANITPRIVSLSGSHAYDDATDAGASMLTLSNLVAGESLTLTGAGNFADKNVGSGKSVSLGTLALANGTNGLASNYTLVGGTDSASITPATLTVSGLSAQNKVYDSTTVATLSGTASLAGVYGGDSVSLNGTATTGAFANRNVGNGKTVAANLAGLSLSGTDAANYQISSVTTPLTADITPATLTVSGLSAQSKLYDSTTAATVSGTASLTGVYGGDAVSLNGTASSGTFGSKNVGTGKAVAVNLSGLSLSGADAGNYQIGSVTTPFTANITAATLTVSGLSAQNKVYDSTTAASLSGTASLAGIFGGDSVSLNGTASSGTFGNKNVGTGKAVAANLSGLSLSGADAGNYQIGSVTTPLTANITPATLTVSGLSAQDKVYNATAAATLTGTATLTGVYAGDSVNFSGTATGTFSDKVAGSGKTVTANLASFSLSGADAGNYQVGSVTNPLTASITPATLSVSGLSAQNKVYDSTTAATLSGTASLAGVYGGDSVTLNGTASSGTFADKNAGTGKSVTANLGGLSLSGADASDYQLGSVTTALTANITPATLTVSGLSAQNKVYDATTTATLTGTAALAGVYTGDSVNFSGTATGAFVDKNVGSGKSVTANPASINLSGADAGNYQVGSVTNPLTANITPATLTVAGLSAQNKVYDATTTATLTGTAALAGIYSGDSVNFSGTATGAFADKNVGSGKSVTANLASINISGVDAGNYQVGSVTNPLTANITPATLTVAGLSAQNKVYDSTSAATLSGTAILTGIYGGDSVTLNGSASGGTFADKNVGTRKAVTANLGGLSLSGADASNYQIGSVTTPLTANVTPATLTVSGLSAQSKVYDSTTAATLTGTSGLSGVYSGDSVSISGAATGAFGDKNVGSAKTVTANLSGFSLSGADAGNYQVGSVTTPLAANITPATLTISGLAAQNKVYDASVAATVSGTSILAGLFNGDVVNLAGTVTSGTFADKNVGTGTTVTPILGNLSLTGADAGNYQLGSATAPLAANITPAILTVSGLSAQHKVYDATTAATLTGAARLAGVYGGDSVSLTGTANTGTFADKNVGNGKAVTANLSGLSLSGADAADYQLSLAAAPLTANITPATLTYVATPVTMTSGAAPPSLGGTVTGFVGGEGVATATSGTLAFTSTARSAGTSGSFDIVGSGLIADNGNYVFVQSPANAQALTVTAANSPSYFTNPTVSQPAGTPTLISEPTAPALLTAPAGQKVGGLNYVFVSGPSVDSNGSGLTMASPGEDHSATTSQMLSPVSAAPPAPASSFSAGTSEAAVASGNTPSAVTDGQQVPGESERAPANEHGIPVVRPARRPGIVDVVVVDGGINISGLGSAEQ